MNGQGAAKGCKREGRRLCGTTSKAAVDDLSGKAFGNWTAIRRTDPAGRRTLCVCRCGVAREIATDALRLGLYSPSCGCSTLTTKPRAGRAAVVRAIAISIR